MKKVLLSVVAAALVSTSVYAEESASGIEVSANMALTSNYVWRGMTQTSDSPAVQGGIDLGYNGFYAGVWGSAIDFGNGSAGGSTASSEFDVYAGYAGEFSGVSYDVGAVQYMYPGDTDNLNFSEAYLSLGYDFGMASVSATYSLGVDAEANGVSDFGDNLELGVSVPLPMDVTLDGAYGMYDDEDTVDGGNTNNFGDYYYVGLTKTFGKFDLSLAYTGMDFDAAGTEDQDNVVATISTSF